MKEIIKEKVQKVYSDKNLFILLCIWLVSYFFGSKIGSFSLGFFTIYPNFILSVAFVPIVFYRLRTYNSIFTYFSFFLFLFFLYSCIWIGYNGSNSSSIFDLRSHLFLLITFLILSNCYLFFKTKKKFTDIVVSTLWIWISCLIIFGFIEVITGFHFSGNYTKSITDTSFKLIDFSPIFIFDNPNDYISNCIITLLILLFVDAKIFLQKGVLISVLFSLFILSIYASARIGQLIILVIFAIVFMKFYMKNFRNFFTQNKGIIILFFCCVFLLIGSNKVFFGKNPTNVNSHLDGVLIIQKNKGEFRIVEPATKLSQKEKEKLTEQIIVMNKRPGYNSSDVRMKLLKNGCYLIKKNPFLGVGPGQFSTLNLSKKVPYNTGSNVSPHNYIIEIVSQYGVLAICFLGYLLILFVRLFRYKTETSFWLIISMLLLFAISFMTSAFIYQPMYWLFITFWIIYLHIEKEKYSVRK